MAPAPSEAGRLAEAEAAAKTNPIKAQKIYQEVVSEGPGSSEAASRDYEVALLGLGKIYRDQKKPKELAELLKTSRSSFSSFAKAKSAKLGTLLLNGR